MGKTRKSENAKAKARYAKLVKKNATRIAKCRNSHCITPKIKKYCQDWKKSRKLDSDKYTACFLENVIDMKAKGLYDSMPACTQKYGCYKIDKSVEAEMIRLENQMSAPK